MANANKGPIAEHMLTLLPPDSEGLALEVGSGTGAQMEMLAAAFPQLQWRPSEYAAGTSVVRGFYEQGPDGPEPGHPVSKVRRLSALPQSVFRRMHDHPRDHHHLGTGLGRLGPGFEGLPECSPPVRH